MARITFDQLIPLYRNTAFNAAQTGGRLHIADHSILETLNFINTDDDAFRDSGILIECDADALVLGGSVELEISTPRTGLGILAHDMDGVFAAGAHRIKEPVRYYVISEKFAYNDATIPETVSRYRLVLRLVKSLSEAAAFVDSNQAEATFFGPGRLRIPIVYKVADIGAVTSKPVDELEDFVFEKIHRDQKAAILSSNVIELCRHQPENDRFKFLLAHLRELVSKAQDGYKLFASEFSYEKIKTKTEDAINDYTSKIHKTFHDIQNQVMGVPVATIIVATQLKLAKECGVEFWANLAVSVGATLFVIFLTIAVLNQLMTLASISNDLVRQRYKLNKEYAAVAEQFLPLYSGLTKRIRIHGAILRVILLICWAGMGMTWLIYHRLTVPELSACLYN